jgi:hypothetical protein
MMLLTKQNGTYAKAKRPLMTNSSGLIQSKHAVNDFKLLPQLFEHVSIDSAMQYDSFDKISCLTVVTP